jgi:hypothetical protein
MRRWLRAPLVLLGLALVLGLAGLLLGGGASSTSAHIADITPPAGIGPDDIHLEIDMDVTDGNPCNPVDTTRNVTSGQTYTVAICLTSAGTGEAPAAFQFNMLYDDTLNTCVPSANTNLDSNPDANTGVTTFTTPSLGASGWDCTGAGFSPPSCDTDVATGPNHGNAFLGCFQGAGTPTLPAGDTISAPIAEVTFTAGASVGDDTMSLTNISAADVLTNSIIDCSGLGQCFAGDAFVNETPTPTVGAATDTPTATNTPTPTNTTVPATSTFTPTPTNTTVPATSTFTPTPTNTTIAATSTFTPTSTNTTVPATATFTPTPTNTPIPPTATFTPTSTNTSVPATATFTPTSTNTSVPATATFTPTATNTPPPPTATTPAAPTATFTPRATSTSTATPSGSVTPTATPRVTPFDKLIERLEQLIDRHCEDGHNRRSFQCREWEFLLNLLENLRAHWLAHHHGGWGFNGHFD